MGSARSSRNRPPAHRHAPTFQVEVAGGQRATNAANAWTQKCMAPTGTARAVAGDPRPVPRLVGSVRRSGRTPSDSHLGVQNRPGSATRPFAQHPVQHLPYLTELLLGHVGGQLARDGIAVEEHLEQVIR